MLSLLSPLVAVTTSVLVGFMILLKEPKSKSNKLLALTAMTVAISISGIVGIHLAESQGTRVLWSKMMLLGIIAFPPLGYSFSKAFIKSHFQRSKDDTQRLFWFYSACSMFFLLLLPGRGITTNIRLGQSAFVFEFTVLGELLLIYFLLALIHNSIILEPVLFSNTRNSTVRIRLLATSYLAVILFLIMSITQILLGMELPVWMLWIGCGLVAMLFVSYVFFELKSKVEKIYVSSQAAYSSILLISTGTYFAILGVSGYILKNPDENWRSQLLMISILGAVFIFLLLLFSSRLKDSIKSFWRQNIYQKRFDYREEWGRFSQKISGSLDLQAISDNLVRHVSDLFRVREIALYIRQGDSKIFRLISKRINHRNLPENIDLSKAELEAINGEQKSSNSTHSILHALGIQRPRAVNSFVALSLGGEDSILGFLYCERANPLKQEALDLLTLFVNQATLAIHNLQLTTKLVESKELESFNRVTSFIVHDLRNHITVLSMLVENTKKYAHRIDFRENVNEALKKTVNEMKALLSKINFARVENDNHTELLSLNELIHEVVNELNISNRTIDVQFVERYSTIPSILANKPSFITLVKNFCLNAIEAMPSGGTLTIETRCVFNSSAQNQVSNDLKQSVEIRFIDDGIGMSEEFVRDKLFHAFSSTKKFGLGIGLFHCKEIIEKLGGHIDLTSAVNKGTIFTISMPVSTAYTNSLEEIVENELILANLTSS